MFDPHAPVDIVTLRGERTSDVDAIGRVIAAAFAGEPEGGQFERRIADTLRADGALSVSLDDSAPRPVGDVRYHAVFYPE